MQVYDEKEYPDIVKYLISMKYVHGLVPVGGVPLPEQPGKIKILFYKEPGLNQAIDMDEDAEIVEKSIFALRVAQNCPRKDFEQELN